MMSLSYTENQEPFGDYNHEDISPIPNSLSRIPSITSVAVVLNKSTNIVNNNLITQNESCDQNSYKNRSHIIEAKNFYDQDIDLRIPESHLDD